MVNLPSHGHEFRIEGDEDGSHLIITVADEHCRSHGYLDTPLGYVEAIIQTESANLRLDIGDGLALRDLLTRTFEPMAAELASLMAGARYPEEDDPDDDCGYEISDPKHPKFYERMAGAADHARKAAKEG
jgi:hypothetical protein